MNRRKFSLAAALACVAPFSIDNAVAMTPALQLQPPPQEGIDYHRIKNAPASKLSKKPIEVLEFFYFGCHACERMDPVLRDWEDKNSGIVSVRRIPVAFSARLAPHVALFSALEQLKLTHIATPKVFAEVLHHRNYLLTRKSQAEFLESLGIPTATFERTIASDTTRESLTTSERLVEAFRIRAVPTVIFDAQYMITVGSPPLRTVSVLDHLLARSRRRA